LKLRQIERVRKKIFLVLELVMLKVSYKDISDSFDNYLLSVADKITVNIKNSHNHDKYIDTSPFYYLSQLFNDTLSDIKFRNTSILEIGKIIP
jgi:hypothetical protein